MNVGALFAEVIVTDVDRAERWYADLLERAPDARPMAGLVEWHWRVGPTSTWPHFGLQVWAEPARAGGCAVTLFVGDLDATAARLAAAGVAHDGPQPGGGARVLRLTDPDGNQLVLVG